MLLSWPNWSVRSDMYMQLNYVHALFLGLLKILLSVYTEYLDPMLTG
jgi:hypothetical protein